MDRKTERKTTNLIYNHRKRLGDDIINGRIQVIDPDLERLREELKDFINDRDRNTPDSDSGYVSSNTSDSSVSIPRLNREISSDTSLSSIPSNTSISDSIPRLNKGVLNGTSLASTSSNTRSDDTISISPSDTSSFISEAPESLRDTSESSSSISALTESVVDGDRDTNKEDAKSELDIDLELSKSPDLSDNVVQNPIYIDPNKIISESEQLEEPKQLETKEPELVVSENPDKSVIQDDQTPISVGNSLVILLHTNVPNHNKLRYDPAMSVPKMHTHTLYFDPLVKYNKSAINSVATDKDKITQFFDAGTFDTMINRTISSFFKMVKRESILPTMTNFKHAVESGYIDNNIQQTLETIFKKYNLFYIKNTPYSVIKYEWLPGNWTIDIKPLETLTKTYDKISQSNIKRDAETDLKMISEYTSGNKASELEIPDFTTPKKTEKLQETTSLIQSSSALAPSQILSTPIKTPDFLPIEDRIEMVETINFSQIPDFNCDPITISLFITHDILKKLQENKENIDIIKTYNEFMSIKKNIETKRVEMDSLFQSIIETKKAYVSICDMDISNISSTNIEKMYELESKLVDDINKYFYLIMDIIITGQPTYFIICLKLIKELKKVYEKMYEDDIGYFRIQNIIISCMNYDIKMYEKLTSESSSDKKMHNYYKIITDLQDHHERFIKQSVQMRPLHYNYDNDIALYNKNSLFLSIKKYKFDSYLLEIMVSYQKNVTSIFYIYYKTLYDFKSNIQTEINKYINDLNTLTTDFSRNHGMTPIEYQNEYKIDNIKYNTTHNIFQLYSGIKIQDDKNDDLINRRNDFIDITQNSANLYENIVLYVYLLQIECMRQHNLFSSELNIRILESENLINITNYYLKVLEIPIELRDNITYQIYIYGYNKEKEKRKDNDQIINKDDKLISIMLKDIVSDIRKLNYFENYILCLKNKMDERCIKIYQKGNPSIVLDNVTKICSDMDILTLPKYKTTLEYIEDDDNNDNDNNDNDNDDIIDRNKDTNSFLYLSYILHMIELLDEEIGYDNVSKIYKYKYCDDWTISKNYDNIYDVICDSLNKYIRVTNSTTNDVDLSVKLNNEQNIFSKIKLQKKIETEMGESEGESSNTNNNDEQIIKTIENILGIKLFIFEKDYQKKEINAGDIIFYNNELYKVIRQISTTHIIKPLTINGEEIDYNRVEIEIINFTGDIVSSVVYNSRTSKSKETIGWYDFDWVQKDADFHLLNENTDISLLQPENESSIKLVCMEEDEDELNADETEEKYDRYIFLIREIDTTRDIYTYRILNYNEDRLLNYNEYSDTYTYKNKCVYDFSDIPSYVLYFIYSECYKDATINVDNFSDEVRYGICAISEFRDMFETFHNLYKDYLHKQQLNESLLELENGEEYLETQKIRLKSQEDDELINVAEREELQRNLDEIETELERIKQEKNSILERRKQDRKNKQSVVVSEDTELKNVNEMISELRKKQRETKANLNQIPESQSDEWIGGNNNNLLKPTMFYDTIQDLNPNIYLNRKTNSVMIGGNKKRPFDEVEEYETIPETITQYITSNNMNYIPQINGLQSYPQSFSIVQQQNKDLFNKKKSARSKLAYYIHVNLVLSPGKKVSKLEESRILCNTVFEKIRKSYADLFGYEYRPYADATISESYYKQNQLQLLKEKEKMEREQEQEKDREKEQEKEQEKEKRGGNKSLKMRTKKNHTIKLKH